MVHYSAQLHDATNFFNLQLQLQQPPISPLKFKLTKQLDYHVALTLSGRESPTTDNYPRYHWLSPQPNQGTEGRCMGLLHWVLMQTILQAKQRLRTLPHGHA
jgi:hypothetical protein